MEPSRSLSRSASKYSKIGILSSTPIFEPLISHRKKNIEHFWFLKEPFLNCVLTLNFWVWSSDSELTCENVERVLGSWMSLQRVPPLFIGYDNVLNDILFHVMWYAANRLHSNRYHHILRIILILAKSQDWAYILLTNTSYGRNFMSWGGLLSWLYDIIMNSCDSQPVRPINSSHKLMVIVIFVNRCARIYAFSIIYLTYEEQIDNGENHHSSWTSVRASMDEIETDWNCHPTVCWCEQICRYDTSVAGTDFGVGSDREVSDWEFVYRCQLGFLTKIPTKDVESWFERWIQFMGNLTEYLEDTSILLHSTAAWPPCQYNGADSLNFEWLHWKNILIWSL